MAVGATETLAAEVGRVSEDAVEAAACDDVGEFEKPMEGAFALGDVPGGGRGLALGCLAGEVGAVGGVGDEVGFVAGGFGLVELGDGDGGDLAEEIGVLSVGSVELAFLGSDLGGGVLGEGGDFAPACEDGVEFLLERGGEFEFLLAAGVVLALGFVGLAEGGGDVLVVAGEGFEGLVGHAFFEFVLGDEADDGVAALDVVVEEVERFAWAVGFQPEGDLAELHGEGVEVHAVDAVLDDIAGGLAEGGGAGLVIAGADDGQGEADAAGGGEKDVAGAAGDVGDAEGEEGGGGIGLLEFLRDEVVEGVLEEGLDEDVLGVVGAGGAAFVALGEGEVEFALDLGDAGFEFEEALIDGAEFLDIEGTVVHPHELFRHRIGEEGELAEGVEEGGVVERAVFQRAEGAGVEEIATERGDAEFHAAPGFVHEAEEGDEGEPGIVVAGIGKVGFFREAAEASERVAEVIDFAQALVGAGGVDEAAFLDDHEEEQAVDEAEEVGVEVGGEAVVRIVGGEGAEVVVGGVGEEAVAEVEDDGVDGLAEAIADAGAGIEGVLVVDLDGGLGDGILFHRQAGGVKQAVEEGEVGEKLLGEDAFEVELDEGEFHQAGGIPEQADEAAVGDDAVEVLGEVEVFLDEAVGRHARGIGHGAAAVERLVPADEVDGELVAGGIAVGDAVGFSLDGLGFGEGELIAEQAEQRDKPLVAGLGGAGGSLFEPGDFHLIGSPVGAGGGPGIGDLILDLGGRIEAEILG